MLCKHGVTSSNLVSSTKRTNMYAIKEYPKDFTHSTSKQWLKFKKKMKKIYHTRLRRGELHKLRVQGQEIAW